MKEKDPEKKSFYQAAGVDIDAGNRAVELIKKHAATTWRPGVLGGIGGFSGLFALDLDRFRAPVLVSGTDGVGTKLRIAQMMRKHDTVGIDLVAMCVNDILVCGAEPLFFLDYLACGKLVPEQAAEVVAGIAAGCREAGCALIGGETAEMPGFYRPGEYDLAGFAVGVVERDQIWDGEKIRTGDAVLGIASTGLHSNGYSLARRVLFEGAGYEIDTFLPELGRTVGEELLIPTKIYAKTVLALKEKFESGRVLKGAAHITGGGILENLPRLLPRGLGAALRQGSWPIPPIFELIQLQGKIPADEMYRVFNMGIGFVLFTRAEEAGAVRRALQEMGEAVFLLGEVRPGSGVAFI